MQSPRFVVLAAAGLALSGCGGSKYATRDFRVPSSSMEPTLNCAKPGDGCLGAAADHVIVDIGKPVKRGDIVVFQTPPRAAMACGAGGLFVKRIVGLPGETVKEDRKGFIWIRRRNSESWVKLNEPYASARAREQDTFQTEHINHQWRGPKDDYFVVGDNLPDSCDSRSWGGVPSKNIIGPVVKINRG